MRLCPLSRRLGRGARAGAVAGVGECLGESECAIRRELRGGDAIASRIDRHLPERGIGARAARTRQFGVDDRRIRGCRRPAARGGERGPHLAFEFVDRARLFVGARQRHARDPCSTEHARRESDERQVVGGERAVMGRDQHTDLLPRLSGLAAGERELTADEGEPEHCLRIHLPCCWSEPRQPRRSRSASGRSPDHSTA